MKPWAILILTALLTSAPASAQTDERQARTLRERGRRALAEGRIEEAFGLFRVAAERTSDPEAWLDVGDAADRLRMNSVAVEAYENFLQRSPNTANRTEIEGRLRVLRHHAGGGSYALGSDGHTIVSLADIEASPGGAAPAPRPRQSTVLVDWQGNPQVRRTTPELLSLAEWDDSLHTPDSIQDGRVSEPAPGLGRALATP